MKGFLGVAPFMEGSTAARLKASSSRRPFSQWTDMRVRMKCDPFGVGPNEDLGDPFLVTRGAEFDYLEPEVPQVMYSVDAVVELVPLGLGEGGGAGGV